MSEFKKIKKRVFKPIKELDAEIRFIESEQHKDNYNWNVEIGLCVSMGERGYIFTLFYDGSEPTESEIIAGIKEHIEEQIMHFEEAGILGYYEEEQLKILKGIVA